MITIARYLPLKVPRKNADVVQWKKYANALRMRYAMRISDVNPQKAKEEFEKAVAAGAIASAADDAYIKYADAPFTYYDGANDYDFRANALSETLYGQDATSPTMVCSTLFYQLQNTNDPRLYRICRHYYNIKRSQVKPDKEQNIDLTDDFLAYFQSKNLGEEPCNPGAAWYTDWMNPATLDDLPTLKKYAEIDANTYANSDYIARASRPCLNIDFEMPSCPGDLMSYAEVEFLKAEAATMGWNVGGGDAESHYEAGVRASMELLNNYYLTSNKISKEEIDAFIANNPLGDNPKETINTQAWILHMMNPSEGWANMRRSDYPAILNRDLLTKEGFTYTDPDWSMPVRLQYPEVGRMEITPDYFLLIDRMNHQYVRVSYADVPFFQQAGIDFHTFQSLFWGELFQPANSKKPYQQEMAGDTIRLSAEVHQQATLQFVASISKALLMQTSLTKSAQQTLPLMSWDYDAYKPYGGKKFPTMMKMKLTTGKTAAQVTLNLSNLKNNSDWSTRTEVNTNKYKQVSVESIIKRLQNLSL